jgi:hypothetical protein
MSAFGWFPTVLAARLVVSEPVEVVGAAPSPGGGGIFRPSLPAAVHSLARRPTP